LTRNARLDAFERQRGAKACRKSARQLAAATTALVTHSVQQAVGFS
jgi:hypothetical protein